VFCSTRLSLKGDGLTGWLQNRDLKGTNVASGSGEQMITGSAGEIMRR
jgi:hypothetical protein